MPSGGGRVGKRQWSSLNGLTLVIEGEIYALPDGIIQSHIPNGSLTRFRLGEIGG